MFPVNCDDWIIQVRSNDRIQKVLDEHNIAGKVRKQVEQVFIGCLHSLYLEKGALNSKDSLEKTKGVDLERLKKDVDLLLNEIPDSLMDVKTCKDLVDRAVALEEVRRKMLPPLIKKSIKSRRSFHKLKENPKSAVSITRAIKRLAPLLSKHMHRKDPLTNEQRNPDQAYLMIAQIFCILGFKFTTAQIRSRYHK